MMLFHVTAMKNLLSIQEEGLRPNSYWSSKPGIRDYYAETVEDEGDEALVLAISKDGLLEFLKLSSPKRELEPDHPGIEEPISTVLKKKEDAIHREWRQSAQDWKASLDIIGSLRCPLGVPAKQLMREGDSGLWVPLNVSAAPAVETGRNHRPKPF